jgi:hypothetical protein
MLAMPLPVLPDTMRCEPDLLHRLAPAVGSPATAQWLDAHAGQPGRPFPLQVDGAGDEPPTRAHLLLLDGRTVLDLQQAQTWALPGLAAPAPARFLSPSGAQIVFLQAERRGQAGLRHFLHVADFRRALSYRVDFDNAWARFGSPRDATPAWLAYHFRWIERADGRERLVWHEPQAPIPAHGRVVDFGRDQLEYRLQPVREPMLDALAAFVALECGVRPLSAWVDDTERRIEIAVAGQRLVLAWQKAERCVSLYAAPRQVNAASRELVAGLASRFDDELVSDQYPHLFHEAG